MKELRYLSNKLWKSVSYRGLEDEANIHIKDFCDLYKLKNLMKIRTYFKNPDNPKIWCWQTQYAVLKTHVQLKQVYLTFRKWQLLSLNHSWKRNSLKLYIYRDYIGKFSNNQFRTNILQGFSTPHSSNDKWLIKKKSSIFSDILFKEFNKSLGIYTFPSCLKMANVVPIYKKGNRSDKDNYRPQYFTKFIKSFWQVFM